MYGQATPPQIHDAQSFVFKADHKLSHSALIGCIASGLTLGAIFTCLMPVELAQRNIAHEDIGGLMLQDHGWHGCTADGDLVISPRRTSVINGSVLPARGCKHWCVDYQSRFLRTKELVRIRAWRHLRYTQSRLTWVAVTFDLSYGVSDSNHATLLQHSSVAGPIVADSFMDSQAGLFTYLFASLLATTIYKLIASLKRSHLQIAGE